MEEKAPSAGQSALNYGLLIAVALIVIHLVLYLIGQVQETAGMIISTLAFVAAIVIAQLDYRNKKLGGFITYGKAVKIGFLSILFASIIVAIYMFIYHSYINPGEMLQTKQDAIQDIYNMGLDPETEAQSIRMQDQIHTPLVYAIGTIFGYALMGIIVALITSIFIKKEEKVSLG
jgi:hypothetical protein